MNGIKILLLLAAAAIPACGYLASPVHSPEIDGRTVTFRVRIRSARTVQVAGNWNNWGRGDGRQGEVLVGLMNENEENGFWEKKVELPPGRYKYIFLVNEDIRILDSNNPRIVPDGKGGKANLLIMPGI
jgi:1,4-alpha-glucan branching enzyme